jgi:hypothetical protein
MSDEFVNNNSSIYDRRLSDHRIDDGTAELDAANELGDELAPQHHRAPARRIGELLVEAYGKAVPKKGRRPVPSIVLLESAQFLVRGVEFRYSIICRFFRTRLDPRLLDNQRPSFSFMPPFVFLLRSIYFRGERSRASGPKREPCLVFWKRPFCLANRNQRTAARHTFGHPISLRLSSTL